jgi:hypothetical protein
LGKLMRYKGLFLLTILIFILISFSLLYLTGIFSEKEIHTNGDRSMDAAWVVIETSDGGYALAGHTKPIDIEDSDYWLVKTDKNGNEEWNQTYGGEKFETAYSLVETSDGGFVLAGDTKSFGAGDGDYWLVKTDKNGNMEWNQTYDNGADERARSLIETSDGGYALAGDISYSSVNPDYGWSEAWLVKTDEKGNEQWSQTHGGTGFDRVYGLVEASDGGYVLGGFTQVWSDEWNDFWLIKTDVNGNLDWNHTYGGERPQEAYTLVKVSNGGYILAGFRDLSEVERSTFWLVKTDEDGNEEWNQTYGEEKFETAYSLVETSDGGFALVGITDYFAPEGYDVVLIKTNEGGNVEWTQIYGGEMSEVAYSLAVTSDGGFILAGYSSSSGSEYPDFWLTKTDAYGNMQWNRTYG